MWGTDIITLNVHQCHAAKINCANLGSAVGQRSLVTTLSASLAAREEVPIHTLCPGFFPPFSFSFLSFLFFSGSEGSACVIANETRVLTMLG